MNYKLNLDNEYLPATVSMLLATIFFCSFWLLFVSPAYQKLCQNKIGGDKGKIMHIISLKYIGVLMLAVLPSFLYLFMFPQDSLASIGISFKKESFIESLLWTTTIGAPLIFLTRKACRRPGAFDTYPQIRVKQWDIQLVTKYSAAWATFMLGYEVLFRGILFFPLLKCFGVIPAIAINTLFYVGSHLPKGAAETFGALLFGPLLCFITIKTGAIWAAGFIHVVLAVSNCIFSVKYNPHITLVK